MKNALLVAGLLLILAFVAFSAFSIKAILKSESLPEGQMLSHVSNLRQLQLAVQSYSADAKAKGWSEIYPGSLQDLVKENIVTQTDLDRLSRFAKITYIQPQATDTKDTLVLTSIFQKKYILAPLEGKIMIHVAD